jgi:hypothetical protein
MVELTTGSESEVPTMTAAAAVPDGPGRTAPVPAEARLLRLVEAPAPAVDEDDLGEHIVLGYN